MSSYETVTAQARVSDHELRGQGGYAKGTLWTEEGESIFDSLSVNSVQEAKSRRALSSPFSSDAAATLPGHRCLVQVRIRSSVKKRVLRIAAACFNLHGPEIECCGKLRPQVPVHKCKPHQEAYIDLGIQRHALRSTSGVLHYFLCHMLRALKGTPGLWGPRVRGGRIQAGEN